MSNSAILEMLMRGTVEMRAYYDAMFESFDDNELFEVYDIMKDQFIQFAGREGSYIMNKTTIIDNLIYKEMKGDGDIHDLIVVKSDKDDISFESPVFVGSSDRYKK